MEKLNNFIPPLRLILTTSCNGFCPYCHSEGCYAVMNMPMEMIYRCAAIANELNIPNLSLTGGEPTLRNNLNEIIIEIQNTNSTSKISLTSNGYRLLHFCDSITKPIDYLNLSFSSFNKNISSCYQNVKPEIALKALHEFPSRYKKLNVVIVEENYLEINDIINYCYNNSISLDIMFELKRYSNNDYKIQKYIFGVLSSLGEVKIIIKNTPVIAIHLNESTQIRLKHPFLSALINRTICNNCEQSFECYERVCAVRVHPNGIVTPCLNNKVISNKNCLSEQINDIYINITRGFSRFEFLIRALDYNNLINI